MKCEHTTLDYLETNAIGQNFYICVNCDKKFYIELKACKPEKQNAKPKGANMKNKKVKTIGDVYQKAAQEKLLKELRDSQHTSTLTSGDPDGDTYPINRGGQRIAEAYTMDDQEKIVRAVNSHEELLAIVRLISEGYPHAGNAQIIRQAKEAIAKAEGK